VRAVAGVRFIRVVVAEKALDCFLLLIIERYFIAGTRLSGFALTHFKLEREHPDVHYQVQGDNQNRQNLDPHGYCRRVAVCGWRVECVHGVDHAEPLLCVCFGAVEESVRVSPLRGGVQQAARLDLLRAESVLRILVEPLHVYDQLVKLDSQKHRELHHPHGQARSDLEIPRRRHAAADQQHYAHVKRSRARSRVQNVVERDLAAVFEVAGQDESRAALQTLYSVRGGA